MTQPPRAPGYRGTLPPRNDRLAVPWVITVVAVFVLVFVLAFAGIPSKLFATPSASPGSSIVPSSSAAPSGVVPSPS
jgi:uncharacterized membrane protein